ncbi:TylF/MycF/NovP-related O-methyltransferase [Salidesulfovibrio brasiliensis]|uniref:TylF/MycF/NovP-related O-methyltransferase n=1 Tax=Salidesulfovibrio brasiliensis TaxID=221711 RepID=UPI0006D1B682|nr:TylF/MycF/NovP-related O-methyltransferase [Salidesulfovibrio brasiliensis]
MSTDLERIAPEEHFFYENAYFLTAPAQRMGKLLAHYELFRRTVDVDGDVVEAGVFKGASLSRFAKFRTLLCPEKRVLGFDIFGRFPRPDEEAVHGDLDALDTFVDSAGEYSISRDKLQRFLKAAGCGDNVELIKGDVIETLPRFAKDNPGWRISIANIDVDLYQPTMTALHVFYDHLTLGGILLLDDYNGFPGATSAIDEFIAERGIAGQLHRTESSPALHYIMKA